TDDDDLRAGAGEGADDLHRARDRLEAARADGRAARLAAAGRRHVIAVHRVDVVGVAGDRVAVRAGVARAGVAGAEQRVVRAIRVGAAVTRDAAAAAAEVARVRGARVVVVRAGAGHALALVGADRGVADGAGAVERVARALRVARAGAADQRRGDAADATRVP